MKISILFLLFLLTLFGYSYADSDKKEEYELQERCSKSAEEFLKREDERNIPVITRGDSHELDDGELITYYHNHYNKKLNKCFVNLSTAFFPYNKDLKKVLYRGSLVDINEHSEYGRYDRLTSAMPAEKTLSCGVLNKVCHSGEEWESFIKPYMEE